MAARQQKGKAKTAPKQGGAKKAPEQENVFFGEAVLLGILAVCILLFLSNFGVGGIVGEKVSGFFFGVFGLVAYLAPVCFFIGAAFYISNKRNRIAAVKLIASVFFVAFLCLFIELVVAGEAEGKIVDSFHYGMTKKSGGGIVGGALSHLLCSAFGMAGAYVVDIIVLIICLVFITERSFLGGVKKGSRRVYDSAREDAVRYREHAAQRREERELREEQRQKEREEQRLRERELREEQQRTKRQLLEERQRKERAQEQQLLREREEQRQKEQQKRLDKKAVGVSTNTKIVPPVLDASDNLSELKPERQTPQFSKNAMAKLFPTENAMERRAEKPLYTDFKQEQPQEKKQERKQEKSQVLTPFQKKTEPERLAEPEPLAAVGASVEENRSQSIEPAVFRAKPTIFRREPTLVTTEPEVPMGLQNEAEALGGFREEEKAGVSPEVPDDIGSPGISRDLPGGMGSPGVLRDLSYGMESPGVSPDISREMKSPGVSSNLPDGLEGPDFSESSQADTEGPEFLSAFHSEMDGMGEEVSSILRETGESGEEWYTAPETDGRAKQPDVVEKVQRQPLHTGTLSAPEPAPAAAPPKKEYAFPPTDLLKKGNNQQGDSQRHLQETALKLQQTLKNFGVNVTISDVSCGPSVTRYELQPEMGVKVSKIVNLADDIKLNLAAPDIRIEAPIPGKAAVGIEVPNKETVMVRFREMVEAEEFRNHKSNICFTAGKDIGGQVVVADIAKMPHLLIAGATGSGKSVCINTIIMSILYKANPEDVKLILIDPKVVELSVYNGIPHLYIPVVTDPKKAAGALHWAVAEMTERYQKFAEYQVRDLKGYNQKIAAISDVEDETKPQKMPQIVIVVDELADLMMVAAGDVEDAICRLAQLARAAGIHMVIATQRPSVDVITGLIKANMPSRIAFSVSSGTDSRTILDMNGAEKLLGNGDMLFYPQGYQKPVRVQGPFVSDTEVEAVVDFLKNQNEADYNTELEEKVNAALGPGGGGSGGNERDAYFTDAGKFVIEKDKGSIGMLQRWFKIGFNRAARIMDQLEEAGVVGPEEGTKPRKILMSMEQFEEFVDEYV